MAYRGEDLDLRTPQGWGAAGRDLPGGEQANWLTRTTIYQGGRADPIWIDANVMACCNHAYDLAVAHRAPEVRLEHLINAMTLNGTASQVLESRGFGVVSLRRESGAIIASDIPASSILGGSTPKRSEALEDTLRLAADHAYPRRTPVTVDDMLHVMIDIKHDDPGVQLLHRHNQGRPQNWHGQINGNKPRGDVRLEPLPHLHRSYGTDVRTDGRHDALDDPRARYGSPVSHDYYSRNAQPYPPAQAPRDREVGGTTIDNLQNNRIDALERAVRDLGLDLAEDRKSLQSVVTDIQRNTASQVDDTGRFRVTLTDRLGQLEDMLHRVHTEPSQIPAVLIDRISSLERNIEGTLNRLHSDPAQIPTALIDRMTSVERSIEARLVELGRAWAGIGDRLGALEAAANRPQSNGLSPALAERLEHISGVDGKIDTLERTFQLVLDRMTGLERHLATDRSAATFDLEPLETRLAAMEHNVVRKLGEGQGLGELNERLTGIERAVENRTAETGRTVSFIGERLRAFDEAIGSQRSSMSERLGNLELMLAAYTERETASGSSSEGDLAELHEALVKLNSNQQTLANSLEQWRLDNTGDLSVVSNRLKLMEETEDRRDDMFQAITQQVSAIHNVIAKREVHKSRAHNWLFGTDEWYSASYDTERWRARQVSDAGQDIATSGMQARTVPPPTPFRR